MNPNLNKIEHIVVLMLENRSFDNMTGWLYAPDNPEPFNEPPMGQDFDGLAGKHLSNPIPPGEKDAERKRVPVGKVKDLDELIPGPGEGFMHTGVQMYGDLVSRDYLRHHQGSDFRLPPDLPEEAPMDGFVRDYIEVLKSGNHSAGYDDYKVIMNSYTPEQVPVISTLARRYAICDRWFGSVPSQSYTNRTFTHAGTSLGLVDNSPILNWVKNDAETIFDRIQKERKRGLSWRIYFDRLNILPATWLLHSRLRPYLFSNCFGLQQFESDAKNNRLPSYAFIEPRVFFGHSDEAPGYKGSVKAGEKLIYSIYRILRCSRAWNKTLFIITYDEHGGCYDHVPPPGAIPPDKRGKPGQYGFRFDRLGPRVPTVLISPYIEEGTVFRAMNEEGEEVPLEHASIIKTITNRWDLKPLTERDKGIYDVSDVLTLTKPRTDDIKIKL